MFRFEVLSKLLTGPTVLRPKLMATVEAKAAAMAGRPGGAGGINGGGLEAGLLAGPPGSGPLSATQLFNSTGLTEHQLAAAAGQVGGGWGRWGRSFTSTKELALSSWW